MPPKPLPENATPGRYQHGNICPWLSVSLTSGSLVRGGRVVTPHVSQRDIGMSSFPRVDTTKSRDEAIVDTDQSNPFAIWKTVINFKVTYLVSSRNHASATVRLPEVRQRDFFIRDTHLSRCNSLGIIAPNG